MKTFFSDHHGRELKLGLRLPDAHPPKLHLADYLHRAKLPDPPAAVDNTTKAMAALRKMYLNDKYGCCYIAAMWHGRGIQSANGDGKVVIATDAQILHDYEKISGFIPGDESTDAGCDPAAGMDFFKNVGFADGVKLDGRVAVDASDAKLLKTAIWLFECPMAGMGLPNGWLQKTAPGSIWDVDGAANPENGHATTIGSYEDDRMKLSTWGELVELTFEAAAEYAVRRNGGQMWVYITPEIIARASAKAPSGFAYKDLLADLSAI